MSSQYNSIFHLAVVLLIVSSNRESLVCATVQSSSPLFFVVKQNQIPTSGVDVIQTVTSQSAISCGDVCLQAPDQTCNGFVFEKATTCDVASNGRDRKFGTCDLMSFTSLASVSFGPASNACQRFYARSSLLFARSGNRSCQGTLRPTLTSSTAGSTSVYAIAVLNNQLFATRSQSASTNQIEVYDSSSLQLLRYITVPGATGYLCGLTIDPTTNSLYVSDSNYDKVYNVNLTTLSSTNWSVATGPNRPYGLSVNSAHNILVGDGNSILGEYTPSGTLVRQISPGSDVYQAVGMTNGNMVVSRIGNAIYDVCLMSNTGQVIYSYGSATQGSGPGQVNGPRGLAVDKQGYILLADKLNDRILALDPTLTAACNVSLPFSPSWPYTVWLDESRDRLYVGEGKNQYRILVFDNFTSISDAFSAVIN